MDQTGLSIECITQFLEKNKNKARKVLRDWKREQRERKVFSVRQVDQQTLQETQQLLVRVNTGWRTASQEHGISRQRSECMPAAHAQLFIHPSIHPYFHPYIHPSIHPSIHIHPCSTTASPAQSQRAAYVPTLAPSMSAPDAGGSPETTVGPAGPLPTD